MFLKQPYTYSVDWWAFGVVLYECTYNMHPFHMFKKVPMDVAIQRCDVRIPSEKDIPPGRFPFEYDAEQEDFISSLLQKDYKLRLGCGDGGFEREIQSHRWFKSIDWDLLYRKEIVPLFVPDVLSINSVYAK